MKPINNNIIIGNKSIELYIFIIASTFEKGKEIEIEACGNNIMKLERIIRLLNNLGVIESNRISDSKYGNNTPHIKCILVNNNAK